MLVRNKRTQNMYLTATNEGCNTYANNKIKIHIHLPECRNNTTQGFNEYSLIFFLQNTNVTSTRLSVK